MPGSWVEAPAYSWPELEGAPDGVEQGGEEVGELAPAARRSYAPAGLFNMGQTCYMNSILQALVSIPDVGRYFIDNDYTNDINATNPLGHKGEMANAFAAVVKQLLTPGAASFTPKAFLSTLRQLWYNLQDEYQQHDAHELMSFLLDAVHEDLNRVQDRKKVPQLEEKDDEPDHLAARRFWEHHSMLNDSEIVRLFQGLYRSAVECKNCKKRSVKFDPFMYMTVSLPEERIQVRVSSVSITGQKTVHPAQSFPKEAKFDDVRKRIGQNNAVVCALSDDGTMVRTAYKSENRISSIYNEHGPPGPLDVFVYEIEPDSAFIAVHHVATGSRTSAFGERFGSALVLSVPPGTYTRAELYRVLLEKLKIYGVLPADFDDATDPPPFLVRAHKNNGPASPTSSDEEGSETRRRSTEEAEQLGLAEPEGPFVTLQPTKFERIVLDWRADAKNHYYRDRGFKSDSDSDDEDARSASSPSKQKPNGILHSPSRPNGVRGGSADGAVQQPPITLEDCIHMFSAPEDLDEDSWTCQRCKRKGMATKRLNLYTLPDVFIVHIKRFRWLDNPGGFSYNKKIDVHVDFPMEMDLSKHALGVKGPAQYRLFAVVNHFGSTFSGHYTTFCDRSGIQELFPDAADGEAASGTSSGDRQPAWFEFDDEAVKKMSESEVKTKWAYLLFYRRLNSDREPAKAVSSETLLAE
ncbi:hypothetical protein DFJ74DRAFT_691636 [Hyaloraphidium curvatum]|nr:hypothetical protein DFJ74DRAFT_691636 [Hyaloraphidium curvatum]